MKPTYGQLLVNLTAARQAVCLLRSMVSCGEQHSDDSRAAIKLALEGVTFDKLTEKSIEQEIQKQICALSENYKMPTHVVLSQRAWDLLYAINPDVQKYLRERHPVELEILTHKDALQGQDVLVLSTISGNPVHNERRLKEVRLHELEQMVKALVSQRAMPHFQLNLAVTAFCEAYQKLNDPNRYGPFAREGETPAKSIAVLFEEVERQVRRLNEEENRVAVSQ